MKFSLKFLFVVLTISSVGAFVVHQSYLKNELLKSNQKLVDEIAEFSPRLEIELPYLRNGDAADLGLEELLKQSQDHFESVVEKRLANPFDENLVSVRNIPVIDKSVSQSRVHIPEVYEATIKLVVNEYRETSLYGVVDLEPQPLPPPIVLKEWALPVGVSNVLAANIDTAEPENSDYRGPRQFVVTLNGDEIFEILQHRGEHKVSAPRWPHSDYQVDQPKDDSPIEIFHLRSAMINSSELGLEDTETSRSTMALVLEYQRK